MTYVLENKNEAERLEKQSTLGAYDFRQELADIHFERKDLKPAVLLDAGCGSGIVTRYLAQQYPTFKVLGMDASDLRVHQAKELAQTHGPFKNLNFEQGSLLQTGLPDASVDGIVCRYVMQHLAWSDRPKVLAEFKRILKPGSQLVLIDVDGFFYNLQPQTPLMAQVFAKLRACERFDFSVGAKLPHEATAAGFKNVTWKIETIDFQGAALEQEAQLFKERFAQVGPVLAPLVGGVEVWKKFETDFFECLSAAGACLYFGKFKVITEY